MESWALIEMNDTDIQAEALYLRRNLAYSISASRFLMSQQQTFFFSLSYSTGFALAAC